MPPEPARKKVGRECRQALYYHGVQTLVGLLDTANHSILALEYRDEYDDGTYGPVFDTAIEGNSSFALWVTPGTALPGGYQPVFSALRLIISDQAVTAGHSAGASSLWSGANCAINAGIHSNAIVLSSGQDLLYLGAFSNSNSLVSTLLANAGVSLAAPPWTPGWGVPRVPVPPGTIRVYPTP